MHTLVCVHTTSWNFISTGVAKGDNSIKMHTLRAPGGFCKQNIIRYIFLDISQHLQHVSLNTMFAVTDLLQHLVVKMFNIFQHELSLKVLFMQIAKIFHYLAPPSIFSLICYPKLNPVIYVLQESYKLTYFLFLSLLSLFRYPVILSIENHCSVPQQKKMAQYLVEILGEKLDLSSIKANESGLLPSPDSLKGKILVKVNFYIFTWFGPIRICSSSLFHFYLSRKKSSFAN